MHSNACIMLRKLAAAVPFGHGGIFIFPLTEGAPEGRGSKTYAHPAGQGSKTHTPYFIFANKSNQLTKLLTKFNSL